MPWRSVINKRLDPQQNNLESLAFLLSHARAQVDEAENPQAVLARMDPDMAIWVRRIRNLPEPDDSIPSRRMRKR